MLGRIHSFQSLGAVDGPGLRGVVFMQGCPLRCVYCHNPDTWDFAKGETIDSSALLNKILRLKHYYRHGGVTVSGGEPLMQAAFVGELFTLIKAQGLHTALDTSGMTAGGDVSTLLAHTDLVLCDLKFPTDALYQRHTGHSIKPVLAFLDETKRLGIPLWLRHVIVPGLTDTPDSIQAIGDIAQGYPNLECVELLGFKKMCVSKYEALGIPFPLMDTPACDAATLEKMSAALSARALKVRF